MPKEEPSGVDELAVLAARPRRVPVYTLDPETDEPVTKKVRVAPMTYDKLLAVALAVRPIARDIGLQITFEQIPNIIVDHGPAVREIVAAATDETEHYIGSLPADQFLHLLTAVWEVNLDFFIRLVGPVAKALASKLFSGAGPTLSSISANTATTP